MAATTGKTFSLATASVVGAAALALGVPGVAWAHVGLAGTSTAAGSSTLLTFAVSHGCEGSATTRVAIRIPDGINAVAPTVNPGWTTERVVEKLEVPVTDGHGNETTERVAEVVYTAREPVADGLRDAFVLSLTLPEDAAGRSLSFPAVQSCVEGENAWVEIPAAGQDPHDLDHPAPALAVTDAIDAGRSGAAGVTAGSGDRGDAAATAGSTSDHPLVVVSLVVGALGLTVGGIALARSQGRPKA